MYVQKPEPPIQEGDVLFRPKESGFGYHFGTAVRTQSVMEPTALPQLFPQFLAAHTMPDAGKDLTSIPDFFNGLPGGILRIPRDAYERAIVEQVAVSDVGLRPYALFDNCETDVNRVQFGVATSPTANCFGTVAVIAGIALLIAAARKN
jgi:hypothetical protein